MSNILFIIVLAIICVSCLLFIKYLIKLGILGVKDKIKPKIGQKWVYKDSLKDPWFDSNTCESLVTITDIRKGYIRYDMSYLTDQACDLDTFVRLYRYVKD